MAPIRGPTENPISPYPITVIVPHPPDSSRRHRKSLTDATCTSTSKPSPLKTFPSAVSTDTPSPLTFRFSCLHMVSMMKNWSPLTWHPEKSSQLISSAPWMTLASSNMPTTQRLKWSVCPATLGTGWIRINGAAAWSWRPTRRFP